MLKSRSKIMAVGVGILVLVGAHLSRAESLFLSPHLVAPKPGLFDQKSGLFNYLSYRDPNLLETLENYDGTGQFLKDLELSDEELVKVIIGAIGGMDSYRLPDAKGYTSMTRHLTGITDEALQQYRDELLSTTQEDFKVFASILGRARNAGHVVVLGSEDAIMKANEKLSNKEKLYITKVI